MASTGSYPTLSLETKQRPFVRGESIPLKVSLINNSQYTLEMVDITEFNDCLLLRMIDKKGKRYSGSLLTSLSEEGFPIPTFEPKITELDPWSRKTTEIDLVKIFGELAENTYRVKAFLDSGVLFLSSEVVHVKVVPSKPVYCMSPRDYMRLANVPQRTSWINQEKAGYYLFIREDSPNLPGKIWANRKLTKLNEVKKVSLSALYRDDLELDYILWPDEERIVVMTLKNNKLASMEHVELNLPNLMILDPPLADADGKLFSVVASYVGGTTSFHVLSRSLDGKIETTQVGRFAGLLQEYCILFDELDRVHIAYTKNEKKACYYTKISLCEKTGSPPEAAPLIESELPIMGIELSRVLRDEKGNRQVCLHFMTKEFKNKIHSRVVYLETKKPVLDSFFASPKVEELALLDVVLDFECNPHHLFVDRDGVLWYKPLESKGLEKATEEDEAFPSNVQFPMLLVSSERSRHYGIYLRYIKGGSRFFCKKLVSLV